MLRLVAHFEVDLPGQCLVVWPDDRPLSFTCTIDKFDVSLNLIAHDHWRMQRKDENDWTRALRAARVKVSREEVEHPPPVPPDERGTMDYTIQFAYFDGRKVEFGAAAREAVNRLIRFFRYSLRTPFLEDVPVAHECFRNARWTDEHGRMARLRTETGVGWDLTPIGEYGAFVRCPGAVPSLLPLPSRERVGVRVYRGAWFPPHPDPLPRLGERGNAM